MTRTERCGQDRTAPIPLGMYVHVPFCARRCGYCAFATTAVGEALDPSVAARYLDGVADELRLAATVLGADRAPLHSVYLGGGTPTTLSVAQVERLLADVHHRFEVDPDAEISIEANPDGLVDGQLEGLRSAGVTRVSFGMQSIRRDVLDLLDRTHDPELALDAVADARAAGFDHVSLDLIHGTPGERIADWDATLHAAIASGVDHVSAYALSIEPGTKLAARVRTGELPRPSDDEAADRYVAADTALRAAGFEWYELSNWARSAAARSRHNLLYWRNHHWWGIGPSAHSHVAGRRWWNHARPDTWTDALTAGERPEAGSELIDDRTRRIESLMLGIRLAEGVALDAVPAPDSVPALVGDGLVEWHDERLVLTLRGRLLADHVVRSLI